MKRTDLLCAALAAITMAPAVPVSAQDESVLRAFLACRVLERESERYACYDGVETALDATGPISPAAAPPRVTAPATPADTPPQVAAPAAEAPKIPQVESAAQEEQVAAFGREARVIETGEGRMELHDRVASAVEREPGRWLVTLESGQRWYQSNSKRYRLRRGMDVRIYASPLGGSWRLSAAGVNGFIQVERVD